MTICQLRRLARGLMSLLLTTLELMLREMLYVDVSRVRSLLGQLDRGVVESVVEKSAHGLSTDMFSAVRMSGLRKSESASEVSETRSLDDILFVAFEEVAEAEGLIRDFDASDPVTWEESAVHSDVIEGELIRIHADVLIVDPNFVRRRFERYTTVANAVSSMQTDAVEAPLAAMRAQLEAEADIALADLGGDKRKKKERETQRAINRAVDEAREKALAEIQTVETGQIQSIADVIDAFFASDGMTIRFLPCGLDYASYSFIGSLLGRDDYIQRERDALFALYGAVLKGWTSLLQVAAVPDPATTNAAKNVNFSGLSLADDTVIERAALERASIDLLAMMDSRGISEGPRWPAISVVPLGVYRPVPRSLAKPDAVQTDP